MLPLRYHTVFLNTVTVSKMVKIEKVKKYYEIKGNITRALDNVSFRIEDGKMAVLAGPSGSGKTTLLNLMGGLDRATEGRILIDGEDILSLPPKKVLAFRRKNIGFIFQSYNLIQSLTAYQNICLPFKVNQCFNDNAKEKVLEILKAVGLLDRKDAYANELSGGQQQRIAIARALVHEPKIILADEPTANLDTENAMNIIKLLRKMNQEKKITIVISSHDQRVIDMVDQKIMMQDGKVKKVI